MVSRVRRYELRMVYDQIGILRKVGIFHENSKLELTQRLTLGVPILL